VTSPVLELSGIVKDYRGLRPLRIQGLSVHAGEQVALLGLDQASAEVLVNLITGTTLADRGDVRLFGRPTSAIEDSSDWLAIVDRIGIVSERAVLLDALSTIQNLSIPFSLEIEPPSDDTRDRAMRIAREVGVPTDEWERAVGELAGSARARVLLGRALALNPEMLLLEHPTAHVERSGIRALGRDIQRIADARRAAVVTLTADADFASASAGRVLRVDPATGRLAEIHGSGWLSRLRGR